MDDAARIEMDAGAEQRAPVVLVVDDDAHVRRALRRGLKRSRALVVEAADADEALAMMDASPAQVVVSDHRMPGRTGVELLRIVKDRWPRAQRILLTGHADTAAVEEAVNHAEIFRFIWKPWDEGHLLLTIQGALEQYALAEENDRLQLLLVERNAQLERLNQDLDVKLEARSRTLLRVADEWRTCFDAIADPVAIVSAGGDVVRANAAFAQQAGVHVTRLTTVRVSAGRLGTLPWAEPRGGAIENREVRDGDRSWLVSSYPLRDGCVVVVYKDVSREREVQRQLLQAEKLSAVGRLAGGVAHEINNPLGGILAFAQLMRREPGRTVDDVEQLRLIEDAATRAKRIVESLLRFARRPQEGERTAVDLAAVVEDALFLLRGEYKDGRIAIERRLAPAPALGSTNQLQQVAVNLLVNAFQAIGKGSPGTVTVSTEEAGGMARLVVSDDGPGVPDAVASRIFEPFFTTKPEGQGTGLGLSICYRIVEDHDGRIGHSPRPEGGARFTVEIPGTAPGGASEGGTA